MMKMILMLASFLVLTFPVFAQEGYPPECRLLPDHKASADVAYQPGVDVYGKPVVPADVNAAPMGLDQQTIVVPLSVDLAQRLQNLNIAGLKMDGTLGFLEIAPGGRITYNGQDLTGQVHVLCDKKPTESAPPANGQTPPDTVKYAPVKEDKPAAKNTPPKPVAPPLKLPEAKKEPAKGELIEGGDYREEGYE